MFCHRCGKPTFESPVVEDTPAVETADVQAVVDEVLLKANLSEITFSNLVAVRVALIVAGIFIALFLPLATLSGGMAFITLSGFVLGSGILAVVLYRRRTGASLNLFAGARLGWITGVFTSVIIMVIFTLNLIPSLSDGKPLLELQQAVSAGMAEADVKTLTQAMQDPKMLIAFILLVLALQFVFLTVLSSLGGMLGAKLFGRDQSLKG